MDNRDLVRQVEDANVWGMITWWALQALIVIILL